MPDPDGPTLPGLASPFLTVADAASYLHLRPATLNNWRSEGTGPAFHKLGRRTFYTRVDLDAWVASCRRRSTTEHRVQESLTEKRKPLSGSHRPPKR
jgi:Helix-turn-helix domain